MHGGRFEFMHQLALLCRLPPQSEPGVNVPRVRMPLLLPLALSLTACLPAPHRVYLAPRISGTVSRDGEPVAGAQLRLRATGTEQVASTITDADGRFDLGPLSELALTTSLLRDPSYAYVLELSAAGSDYPGLTQNEEGFAPPLLPLDCDLARPRGSAADVHYCERH